MYDPVFVSALHRAMAGASVRLYWQDWTAWRAERERSRRQRDRWSRRLLRLLHVPERTPTLPPYPPYEEITAPGYAPHPVTMQAQDDAAPATLSNAEYLRWTVGAGGWPAISLVAVTDPNGAWLFRCPVYYRDLRAGESVELAPGMLRLEIS